jgi:hypothetical protein
MIYRCLAPYSHPGIPDGTPVHDRRCAYQEGTQMKGTRSYPVSYLLAATLAACAVVTAACGSGNAAHRAATAKHWAAIPTTTGSHVVSIRLI